MHHPTDRITHTTAFVTPVVEHWLEIGQWVHHEGSIVHRTMSERSYHGATFRSIYIYIYIYIYTHTHSHLHMHMYIMTLYIFNDALNMLLLIVVVALICIC